MTIAVVFDALVTDRHYQKAGEHLRRRVGHVLGHGGGNLMRLCCRLFVEMMEGTKREERA